MRYAWVSKVSMVTLFGVLVLVGSPYTASAVTPVSPPAPAVPRVVDATGKLVGEVIGTSVQNGIVAAHVVLNISAPSIIVQVTGDSFRGSMPLVYAAANCAGQPYYRWASELGENQGPGHQGPSPILLLPTSVFPFVAVANDNVYVVQPLSHREIPWILSTWDVVANKCVNLPKPISRPIVGIADPIFFELSTEFHQPYTFVYP